MTRGGRWALPCDRACPWLAGAPVTYLQDLYADPEVRGSGVGRALIETVYADADAEGRPNVYWTTQTGNLPRGGFTTGSRVATDFMKYSRS
jgi:GNAT superfamily N-acetyltransferase